VPNIIHNEPNLETMSRMATDSIDLIVTSPPYNFAASGTSRPNKYKEKGDKLTQDDYFEWSKEIITECIRVSKLVCYNIQMLVGNKEALFKLIAHFSGNIREIMIWDKLIDNQYQAINPKVLNSDFEFIFILAKDGGGRMIDEAQFEKGAVSNVIRLGRQKMPYESHGACMPEQISDKLINWFSKKGDIIYDPFMGAGTTAVSALKYHRKFIGSEIDAGYCKIARERIHPYLTQYDMFEQK